MATLADQYNLDSGIEGGGFAPHQSTEPSPLGREAVKKSTIPVILSAAKNLRLFVFKKINADASLRSERVTFLNIAERCH